MKVKAAKLLVSAMDDIEQFEEDFLEVAPDEIEGLILEVVKFSFKEVGEFELKTLITLIAEEIQDLKGLGLDLAKKSATGIALDALNLNELRALNAKLLNLLPACYAEKLKDLTESELRILSISLLKEVARLNTLGAEMAKEAIELSRDNLVQELEDFRKEESEAFIWSLDQKYALRIGADVLAVLQLVKLKAMTTALVAEAGSTQIQCSAILKNQQTLKMLDKRALLSQLVVLIKKFPEKPCTKLALDRKFVDQEQRLDAIIYEINNGRFPTYRIWELLHENLYVAPIVEFGIAASSRTFLACAFPKLNFSSSDFYRTDLDKLLDNLKYKLEEQWKHYLETPMLLAGREKAITVENLFLTQYGFLNRAEYEVPEDRKDVLRNYLPKKEGVVSVAMVDTHNTASHRSSDESHVGAFKMMVAANPNLNIEVEYSEGNRKGDLHRHVEILCRGSLDAFVAKNLFALKDDIENFISTEYAVLYDIYIRASDKDTPYRQLLDEPKVEADNKVNGLLFQAGAAKRFMDNMIKDRKCDSGAYKYSTNVAASCGLTMEEMVATCYWASRNEANFKANTSKPTRADTLFALIRQLYDMRRGYDIDKGKDKPYEGIFPVILGADSNRCHGGCVNSLASALEAIHKAYNVRLVLREAVEKEIKGIYEKIVIENIEYIKNKADRTTLIIWAKSGKVLGPIKQDLEDIFEIGHKEEVEDLYKGYIADNVLTDVILKGLDNVAMPAELGLQYVIDNMSDEGIYDAILNNILPILHLNESKGYMSTLNHLEELRGGGLVSYIMERVLNSDFKEPKTQDILLYLSRSKLAAIYSCSKIKLQFGEVKLEDLAILNKNSLDLLVRAESLEQILHAAIGTTHDDLFTFYAAKIGFTEETLKLGYGTELEPPLHFVARIGDMEMLKLILAMPCAVSLLHIKGGYFKGTPLHSAMDCDEVDIVKAILEIDRSEDSLQIQDKNGQTALHFAIFYDNYACAELILKKTKEADLSIQDNDGNTSLHLAILRNKLNFVKAILEISKATLLHIRNKKGQTPCSMAYGSEDCIDISRAIRAAKEDARRLRIEGYYNYVTSTSFVNTALTGVAISAALVGGGVVLSAVTSRVRVVNEVIAEACITPYYMLMPTYPAEQEASCSIQ